jgi:hypothetical protein
MTLKFNLFEFRIKCCWGGNIEREKLQLFSQKLTNFWDVRIGAFRKFPLNPWETNPRLSLDSKRLTNFMGFKENSLAGNSQISVPKFVGFLLI